MAETGARVFGVEIHYRAVHGTADFEGASDSKSLHESFDERSYISEGFA